jgi:hypothetical protein
LRTVGADGPQTARVAARYVSPAAMRCYVVIPDIHKPVSSVDYGATPEVCFACRGDAC